MTLPIRKSRYSDYRGYSNTQLKLQNEKEWEGLGQMTKPPTPKDRTLELDYEIHQEIGQFRDLLIAMRRKARLSIAGCARRLGVKPETINQYYRSKRGAGGNASLIWFLRYAEATGCKIYLVFPTDHEVRKLDSYARIETPPLKGIDRA